MAAAWVLLGLLGVGRAAVPLVYDADEDAAAEVVAAAAQRTGLPADQLAATPLEGLLDAPPRAVGAAALRHCTGAPVRMNDIRAELVRAEAALSRADLPDARDRLDIAVSQMACLTELVDQRVASRIFLLRGGLAAEAERATDARAEMRSALSFQDDAAWPDTFPAVGAPLLAEEQGAPPEVTMRALPPETSSGPWLDGHELDDAHRTRPGLHLVQTASTTGIRSAWLVLGEDATLVLPESYRSPILARILDPARQAEVAALLQAALPDLPAAYVAHGGGLWLVTLEAGAPPSVEELISPPPPPPPEPEKIPWWRRLFGGRGDPTT